MKKICSTLLAVVAAFALQAQDTLKHYDIFDLVESPPETQVQPSPWGYSYGHGASGAYEWAEKYYVSSEMEVTGVIVYLDETQGSATSEEETWVAIYQKDGNKPSPSDQSEAKETVMAKDLSLGLNSPSVVMFSSEVTVEDTFFAAFGVPKYPNRFNDPRPEDAIGLYVTANRSNDPNPDIFFKNALRTSGGFWVDPTGIVKGDKKRNFLISPIVQEADDTTINVETPLLKNDNISVKGVYPNPVANETKLQLSVSQKTDVNVQILSMTGQHVKTLQFADLASGEHELQLDLTDVESGQYIYVVQSDYGVIASVLNKQ